MDEGENLEQAAVREVREEGGVVAKVIKKLPVLKVFFKHDGELVMKFITYFVMEYIEDAPEGFGEETAETKWVTKDEAAQLLAHKNEQELLERLVLPVCFFDNLFGVDEFDPPFLRTT